MSSWQGKSRGNVLGYRIFVFLLRHFGVKPAYLLLRFVASYYILVPKGAFYPIFNYFKFVHHYSPVKAFFSVYKNFYSLGQTLIDKVAVMAGFSNKFTYHFDGEENLIELANGQKGAMLISAHLGNWEIAGDFLKKQVNEKINVVMFDAEHQRLKSYFDDIDVKRRVNIIVIRDGISHIFEINKALKNNELVCMHGDRFSEGNKSVAVSFFGKEAHFPVGPFKIACSLGVPYSFVYAFKETDKHYHFYSTPGKVHHGDVEDLIKEYVKHLEGMVKKYPLQWFNYYDFWQPVEKTKS